MIRCTAIRKAASFHGYYDCYCYLPLYIFCGTHLLAVKQRCANIDASAGAVAETARIVAQIHARWPEVRIVLRAASGFARDGLMSWCEANGVDFLFGLAKNVRLVAEIAVELIAAELTAAAEDSKVSGQAARQFQEFQWSTRDSWSRPRRVVAKAEWTAGAANPRFVVTSLRAEDAEPRPLCEEIYCARGDMENRIKECQLDLFADRTSAATARQPAAAVVCVDGLWAAVRIASPGTAADPIRPRRPAARSASRC
jgi:Transposase DDE domain group 1